MGKPGGKVSKRAKEKPFLPDEIITNVLIRLPVKSLVRFELVCRKWSDIILARDFMDLHSKSRIPAILIFSRKDLFAVDKWWEFVRKRAMICRFPVKSDDFPRDYFPYEARVRLSHAGLIALVCSGKIYILNPARPIDECVKITTLSEGNISGRMFANICAVYYHPSLQEYVALFKMESRTQIIYKLLTLGSDPSMKTIASSLNCRMNPFSEPVYVNGYVYWLLMSEHEYKYSSRSDILEFDIIREEFVVIPCPIPLNTKYLDVQTHLLNNDGILVFILVLLSTITIWSLEDREDHLWTSVEYAVSLDDFHSRSYNAFRIISLADGMLAYEYERRLFICNLKEGSVNNIPKKRYAYGTSFFSHQMSLASLKNCKSEIWIDKDGELLQCDLTSERK